MKVKGEEAELSGSELRREEGDRARRNGEIIMENYDCRWWKRWITK